MVVGIYIPVTFAYIIVPVTLLCTMALEDRMSINWLVPVDVNKQSHALFLA